MVGHLTLCEINVLLSLQIVNEVPRRLWMRLSTLMIGFSCVLGLSLQTLQAEVTQIMIALPDADASQTGRLFVVFTKDKRREPRLNISDSPAPRDASPFFAVDVENWDGSKFEFQPAVRSGFAWQLLLHAAAH
jgi:hypothetical protein